MGGLPAGAMPAEVDVDELVRRLDAEGWVIVPGWIDADEVARQRAAMESVPVLRQHSPSHAPHGLTVRAHNLLGKTRACDHIAMDPRALAVVGGHLRDSLRFSICTLMDILPGEASQNFHQCACLPQPPRWKPWLTTRWAGMTRCTGCRGPTCPSPSTPPSRWILSPRKMGQPG